MTSSHVACAVAALTLVAAGAALAQSAGEPLTADRAVAIALRQSPQVVTARAAELDARSGLYSAYSGMLPRVSVDVARTDTWTKSPAGQRIVSGQSFHYAGFDNHDVATGPAVTGSWNVLDLASITGVSAARQSVRSAELGNATARNEVALAVRRQFYTVVQTYHLAQVNAQALKFARDSERRVRALFEVGSVSRSDVLQAQVQTAQSQLDSLSATNDITTQRNALASLIGMPEERLGDVDTTLTTGVAVDPNEGSLLDEASHHRPDLLAAEASLKAAALSRTSARMLRLPYVSASVSGQLSPRDKSTYKSQSPFTRADTTVVSHSNLDHQYSATLAINWDIFSGFATESRIASADAAYERAKENRDALRRNLAAEVHAAALAYRQALESETVGQRAVESAAENLNLTQQKYNVGSSTILDLINAQVNLQRAENQEVSARAGIKVAEAGLRRVAGRSE